MAEFKFSSNLHCVENLNFGFLYSRKVLPVGGISVQDKYVDY